MSFGIAVSDIVKLVKDSTRIYLAFKDADDSEGPVQGLVREFVSFHQCLLQLEELMTEYGKPLPFPYLDFKETIQHCEKILIPMSSIAIGKKKSLKKFIYQIKYVGREKEVDRLRARISGHYQALQMCISFLQLRLHLEATKQTQRLLDTTPFRSVLSNDYANSSNDLFRNDKTASDALKMSPEADGLYKDWLIFDRWLKNEDERLAQGPQVISDGDAPRSDDKQTAAVLFNLRRELEDAIKVEENRAKRMAGEKRVKLNPSDEIRQEMGNLPTIPRRTYTLDADNSGSFSSFDTPSMPRWTETPPAATGTPSVTPLSASPKIPHGYFEAIDWGKTASEDTALDAEMSRDASVDVPDLRPMRRTLSKGSLATLTLGESALRWNKLCRKVDVKRTASNQIETRICDIHWRYGEDAGLNLRSVYRGTGGQVRVWVAQHFPATGPSIPLTMTYPKGESSITFPRKSFGKLNKQCTDVRYTFANQDDSRRFQEVLYTNGGRQKAELLYDRPVLTVSSDLNRPESRGKNIRLWRKSEQNADVLMLLFYTSALPEDSAHWVEEPHYAFQWLHESVKKHSDHLTLIFNKDPERQTGNKLFERKWSYQHNFSKDQIRSSKSVDSTHTLGDIDAVTSSTSMSLNNNWTESVPRNPIQRTIRNWNRFGYDRLEIRFQNRGDQMAFVDIWKNHVNPTLHVAPTQLEYSESERSTADEVWTRSENKLAISSMQSTSRKLMSTNPTSMDDDAAESSHVPVQDGTSERNIETDDDIWSVISEAPKDDEGSAGPMPLIRMDQWRDEIINGIIIILATNESLTPLYDRAARLLPRDRFIKNFRRLLMTFRNDLAVLPKTRVTQELTMILRSEGTQRKIVEGVMSRQTSSGAPLSNEDIARIQDSDESIFSKLERLFSDGQIPPPPPDTPQDPDWDEGEADSDTNEEEIPLDPNLSQRPRVDQVIQTLVSGQPFQDMISSLREFLLPHGLLNDILPIPRDRIRFDTSEKFPLLNRAKGWLEDVTGLEWDWWPLAPRMQTLIQGETRVFWTCFCGKMRSRILKPAQKDILEDILQQPPAMYRRPLLCASFTSPAARTTPQSRPAPAQPSNPSSASSGTIMSPARQSPPANSGTSSQLSSNSPPNQTSPSVPLALNGNIPPQNHYQQKKPLWFIFKIEGPRAAPVWDQFGDENLVTDRSFQQKLKQRHHQLRGRLRLWFSYWRLSYWEFVKLQKTRPGRLVDRGIDLPLGGDYDYSPRPPKITAQDPWISKHEFEEIVNSCITPCWRGSLPNFLGIHDCACPEANAVRLVDALPKRDSEFVIDGSNDQETYVWGIHARYVVSGLYVFLIHVGILIITFGFWIWWQKKHPDDLQGASVPVTVAGICVSTFWASTGILKGLR
ncbi:hypothetical protein N0V90_006465 [Kalmusia sp. IMI 367209]|nr:hypothetical protein N0V90_006465 [Kalmusia sp. IMI 367209]